MSSPARALLDSAATLSERELRRAVREAQARLVTLAELVDILGRLPRRRGSRRLARIVATGPAPTRSVLETVLRVTWGPGDRAPGADARPRRAGRRAASDELTAHSADKSSLGVGSGTIWLRR